MPERSQYQLDKDAKRRAGVTFNRRDDVRDLMKSPAGKNYGNMLDLQNQAIRMGGFEKDDPRIAELKKARRQYNRKDKYNIANQMGYSAQDANEIYRQNSGVLREHARPTYKTMYPISDMAHAVTGSGGLTGMLLNKAFGKSKKAGKNFFDDLRQMGTDIFGGIGIGGAVPRDEATEEILTNYSDKTFGPINIHDDEFIDTESWTERDNVVIPPDYPIDEGAFTSLNPFDDSRREAAIMAQYPGKEIEEVTEEYEGPWPHDERSLMSDEQAAWLREMNQNPYYQNLLDPNVVLPFEKERRGHPHRETYTPDAGPRLGSASPHDPTEGIRVAPWLLDPSLPMPVGEEAPPIIPFDDSFRESGIRGLSQDLKPNKYEDEFRAYIESGGEFMPYHQFERMYEKIYQGKPHALHSSYR